MEAYVSIEEAVQFIGKPKDIVEYYILAAAEMINTYCEVHALNIAFPPQSIVSLVNLELAKEMINLNDGVKSERIGEESYTYSDSRMDDILGKLNFLPSKEEELVGINTVNVRVI